MGPGSLAGWGSRLGALVLDWGASMVVALGAFGGGVLTESGWKAWMVLAVYFVQKAVLTALVGGSFGQLISKIGVTRVDGTPIDVWRSIVRSALVCLVLPAVVIGPDRRGINDLLLGTVVVNRR
ncbi:MAG: RDD family protein [Acidimicrobiales bacterium]|nr:RDD family protein [Acidimicrobiales bacterium]